MEKPVFTAKANILYGATLLIPIAIFFLVLVKIVEILEVIAKSLGLDSAAGAGIAIILALLFLIALCFFAGAFVRSQIGSLSLAKLERAFLHQIPGYMIVKNMIDGFTNNEKAFPPALIRLHDAGSAALGFVMEENENGTMTVFIPSTPTVTVGRLYVVATDRVTVLDTSVMDFLDSISQWGVGSGKFLKNTSP